MTKYTVNTYKISTLLGWIDDGKVAIPEIQRPFVWNNTKVRDLVDSLYKNYPVGYIIAWENPEVRLKDGSLSQGKNIIIDGQQRITALRTALKGDKVVRADYSRKRIQVSFNPMSEKFEIYNAAIARDKKWIADIADIFKTDFNSFKFVNDYVEIHPEVDGSELNEKINRLRRIEDHSIGIIELDQSLSIEVVNEIFIRINSKGTQLSQSDFVMSKIAVGEENNGPIIRQTIDYFANIISSPSNIHNIIDNDKKFIQTDYFHSMKWVEKYESSIYQPNYTDIIRVVFAFKFLRGRLSDLVSLLSGRNFETRKYEETTLDETFDKLEDGLLKFINETNFKRFVAIIKSTGVVQSKMIRSQNAINFAYALFLLLREKGTEINDQTLQKTVRRWFVLSLLTSRYSGSSESKFAQDIQKFNENDPEVFLKRQEEGELSESFWSNILIDELQVSSTNSTKYNVFLMAQVYNNDKAFLSDQHTVRNLIEERGDIHHVFPKKHLQDNGYSQRMYNQVANYVYAEQPLNIKIGKKSPKEYLGEVIEQIKTGHLALGEINSLENFQENLKQNAIPENITHLDIDDYHTFLDDRRNLMAQKTYDYYFSL